MLGIEKKPTIIKVGNDRLAPLLLALMRDRRPDKILSKRPENTQNLPFLCNMGITERIIPWEYHFLAQSRILATIRVVETVILLLLVDW